MGLTSVSDADLASMVRKQARRAKKGLDMKIVTSILCKELKANMNSSVLKFRSSKPWFEVSAGMSLEETKEFTKDFGKMKGKSGFKKTLTVQELKILFPAIQVKTTMQMKKTDVVQTLGTKNKTTKVT